MLIGHSTLIQQYNLIAKMIENLQWGVNILCSMDALYEKNECKIQSSLQVEIIAYH